MVAAWAFLVAVSRGCSLVAVGRLLIMVAPLVEEHALQGAGARALRLPALEHGPVVVGHRPSCSVICGIFPEQESNLYPLHLQADSYPLHLQERNSPNPNICFLRLFTISLCYQKKYVGPAAYCQKPINRPGWWKGQFALFKMPATVGDEGWISVQRLTSPMPS